METFDSSGPLKVLKSFQSHSGPVTCISTMQVSQMNSEATLIASGSMDQTLYTHLYTPSNSKIQSLASFTGGHFASISSVAWANTTNTDGTWLASGDFDGGLCLWKAPISLSDNASEKVIQNPKKMKRENKSLDPTTIKIQEQNISPIISFKAHTHNLSGIVWSHDSTDSARLLITSSWDHSIKSWDMEKQNNITTLNGSKVVTCLGRCMNSDVVATGHPDCSVRLWDMRSAHSQRAAGHVSDSTLLPR
jgi:ribosome biogenesis protein YTM1